jgi:transcriptional regulator with XRE-family HTH domain
MVNIEAMQKPYQKLGEELKDIRQKHHESLAEVSGAVEIDTDFLERIEGGQERPSEDVLMLLISHFNIADEDSLGLWQLAGYYFDQANIDRNPLNNDPNRGVVVMMALDSRIVYSDDVEISVDKKGVVVNFLQHGSLNNQQIPIARVGMSHEQAKDLLRSLHQSLVNGTTIPVQKRLTVSKPQKMPKNKKSKSQT